MWCYLNFILPSNLGTGLVACVIGICVIGGVSRLPPISVAGIPFFWANSRAIPLYSEFRLDSKRLAPRAHAKKLTSRNRDHTLLRRTGRLAARWRTGQLWLSLQPQGWRLPLPPRFTSRSAFRFEDGDAKTIQDERDEQGKAGASEGEIT